MPVLTDPLGWFTLQFPEGWQQATDQGVTTLRSPRDIGLVYVSGGRHSGGPVSGFGGIDFLLRFLDYIGVSAAATDVSAGQSVGCRLYSYQRVDDGRYWCYWSITDDETALLVSYTCATERASEEAATVEAMVRSVRLYGSTSLS
jgi:hypothetical protein